jgi:hypothetical protein
MSHHRGATWGPKEGSGTEHQGDLAVQTAISEDVSLLIVQFAQLHVALLFYSFLTKSRLYKM